MSPRRSKTLALFTTAAPGLAKPSCWVATLALLACPVGAAEYFFDSVRGVDTNDGATPDRPLQSLGKLARLPLGPADTVHFRRGCTWRGQVVFAGNGEPQRPLRLAAYGDGPKPEFLGSVRLTGWQAQPGGSYRVRVPAALLVGDPQVNGVFLYPPGSVPVRLHKSDGPPTKRGTYRFDSNGNTLAAVPPDGRSLAEQPVEVSVVTPLLNLTDRQWVEVEGLAFLFGGRNHWRLANCRDVTFRNCAALCVGDKNPAVVVTDHSERVRFERCFIYDCVNNGIKFNDGATHCVVTGCTISKLKSNDGITCHDGPPVESGDHNVIENNVISFCPENSVDITSGDYHVVRGNICYRDGESDIALGHGADHILVQNNLCFGATRSGIKVGGNPAEGFRGADQIWQNLIFDCGYPGLEIEASSTQVLNNTIVNARDRPGVRLSGTARDVVFRNNLIATLDKTIPHPCLQFARSDPKTLNTLLSHNVFFHAGRGGKNVSVWVGTRHEDFTPEETVARYGVGQHCVTGDPRFAPASGRRFFLAADSPCVDAGVEVGLPFVGKAPDVGWKELGSEAEAPSFPEVMIESPEDDAAVLYLWGKTTDKPARASTLLAQ